ALLSMIIVNNLQRHGYKVTVFSDYLFALRDWFAGFTIQPQPAIEQCRALFSGYDYLLHAYASDVLAQADQWHTGVIILDQYADYRLKIPMVDIQQVICRNIFSLV